MRFSLAAFAVSLSAAVAGALEISSPNGNNFWVQNASNIITWSFNSGDPNPIDIYVINAENTTLNGPFAIASSVNLTEGSFVVTNVTLRPGDNYKVQFSNISNVTQAFALSDTFTVKPPGTTPANVSTTSPDDSSTTSTSSTSPTPDSNNTVTPGSGAGLAYNAQGAFGLLAACGIASLSALLL